LAASTVLRASSLVVLRDRLIEIYKSNQPDMISIILETVELSDFEATTRTSRIQNQRQDGRRPGPHPPRLVQHQSSC